MDQLSFGLPTTGSEIHFTWSNGVITLSDKFTGYIRTADGHSIRIEDGNWIYRTFGEPIEHVRLPHPCVPPMIRCDAHGKWAMSGRKQEPFQGLDETGEGSFQDGDRAAYYKEESVSCKCVSLLHGHEPGCPMEGK